MTKLEQHRQTWQGKSDEWLFERLALELTQKVEEIHKLLAENEQLRLGAVVGRSELLQPNEEANRCKRCNCYGCVCDAVDGI